MEINCILLALGNYANYGIYLIKAGSVYFIWDVFIIERGVFLPKMLLARKQLKHMCIVNRGNGYETWQNNLFYTFVRFFALTVHKTQ